MPGAEEIVVATIEPGDGYHLGCPRSALVAVEDGGAPRPVDIAKVEPAGGVTDEVRKHGEANLAEHNKVRHPK